MLCSFKVPRVYMVESSSRQKRVNHFELRMLVIYHGKKARV